jgi:hypothetical protein
MWINISQAVVLLPLFLFAYHMYHWENSDLVPIRCVTWVCHAPGAISVYQHVELLFPSLQAYGRGRIRVSSVLSLDFTVIC